MATEQTPLSDTTYNQHPYCERTRTFSLVKNAKEKVANPPSATWESRGEMSTFFYLLAQTFKNHYFSLIGTILSALLCGHNNKMSQSIFDPLIFKSIFVVFGFAIGFRNMRANERRGLCLSCIRNLCHASWDLLLLLPHDEKQEREQLREQLICAVESISDHVMRVADRGNYKFALSGTEPCCIHTHGVGQHGVNLGPTTFVGVTLLALEDEMSRMQAAQFKHGTYGACQKYQRTFWAKKLIFDQEHYNLINFAIPSVSDAYVALINSSLFIFGLVLPWGLHCHHVQIEGIHIMNAETFLIMNTLVVMCILLGLNTLASQHEDPFMPSYEQIDVRQHIKMFRIAVEHYDKTRTEFGSLPRWEDPVALHEFITNPHDVHHGSFEV